MANELDELTAVENTAGRDIKVIDKQLPIKVGVGSKIFEIILWCLGIIPGLIFLFVKINAGKYLSQLQQKLQHDASQIDNYLEQRVVILQNCAKLLDKAIDLDKDTFTQIAALRSSNGQNKLNDTATAIENVNAKINLAFEQYPDLRAHQEIQDAMQQNSYLQREITAAREVYNDTVNQWNTAVYEWPAKQIVAAKRGYTTRVPFITTSEIKQAARGTFF
jgi:LemA protein